LASSVNALGGRVHAYVWRARQKPGREIMGLLSEKSQLPAISKTRIGRVEPLR